MYPGRQVRHTRSVHEVHYAQLGELICPFLRGEQIEVRAVDRGGYDAHTDSHAKHPAAKTKVQKTLQKSGTGKQA